MKHAALLVVLVLAGVGGAATASRSVPSSTLGIQKVRVSGATMTDISYTVTASSITALTVKLRGSQVLKVVTAAFNGGGATPCLVGLYNATSNTTSVTCSSLAQQANRSWTLQITVS